MSSTDNKSVTQNRGISHDRNSDESQPSSLGFCLPYSPWTWCAVVDGSIVAMMGYVGSLIYGAILAEVPQMPALFRAVYTTFTSLNVLITWKILETDLFDPHFHILLFALSTPWTLTSFVALSDQVQEQRSVVLVIASVVYALAFGLAIFTPFLTYIRKLEYSPSCRISDVSFYFVCLLLFLAVISLALQFISIQLWRVITVFNYISGTMWLLGLSLKKREDVHIADVVFIKTVLGLGIGLSTFAIPSLGISLQTRVRDEKNWPIYGILYYVSISTLITIIVADAIDVLPDGDEERMQLALLTLQFFQEFSVAFVFVDKHAIFSIQYGILIFIICIIDTIIETGIGHNVYYNLILRKNKSDFERKLNYMLKKYRQVRIKMWCECVSTSTLFFMALMEYLFADGIGISYLSGKKQNSRDNIDASSLMVSYSILIILEQSIGWLCIAQYKKRLIRLNEAVAINRRRIARSKNFTFSDSSMPVPPASNHIDRSHDSLRSSPDAKRHATDYIRSEAVLMTQMRNSRCRQFSSLKSLKRESRKLSVSPRKPVRATRSSVKDCSKPRLCQSDSRHVEEVVAIKRKIGQHMIGGSQQLTLEQGSNVQKTPSESKTMCTIDVSSHPPALSRNKTGVSRLTIQTPTAKYLTKDDKLFLRDLVECDSGMNDYLIRNKQYRLIFIVGSSLAIFGSIRALIRDL